MERDETVKLKALECAKAVYWDPLRGDEIESQAICQAVFDASYNCGQETSGKWLQNGLNELNVDGSIYPDIKVDGKIGDGTLAAVKSLLEKVEDGEWALWLIINIQKGQFYIDRSKEAFVKGLELKRTFYVPTMRRLFPGKF